MIDGAKGLFNPTRSEQEMPYTSYRSVLRVCLYLRAFGPSNDEKNAGPLSGRHSLEAMRTCLHRHAGRDDQNA
jgi:hypothetical protein